MKNKRGEGSLIIDYEWLQRAYKLTSGYEKELGEQARQARLKPSFWPCLEVAWISFSSMEVSRQLTAGHSDKGSPGLRQRCYVVRHHHTPLTISPSGHCSKTTCWRNQKSVPSQGFHHARDAKSCSCDSAKKSHPVVLAVGPSLSVTHSNQHKHAFEDY